MIRYNHDVVHDLVVVLVIVSFINSIFILSIMVKQHFKVLKKCSFVTGRNRKARPKTFPSEAAAKKWAENQGIKQYTLENLKSPDSSAKKIRVNLS